MNRRYFICTLFCICTFYSVQAQRHDLNCKNITTDYGKPELEVRCVYQDSDGIMWFATFNGLMRFDGTALKVIGNDYKNKNSFASELMNIVEGDTYGNLWVSHSKGISCYDTKTGNIRNFNTDLATGHNIENVKIDKMAIDHSGNVWFANYEELFQLETRKYKISRIDLPKDKKVVNRIRQLSVDSYNNLWVVKEGSLYHYDNKTHKISLKIQSDKITHIVQQNDTLYWISTWGNGLMRYNGKQSPDRTDNIDPDQVYLFGCRDLQNNMYFITDKGIAKLSCDVKSKFHLNVACKSEHTATRIYFDCSNHMWISSPDGAILIDYRKQFIKEASFKLPSDFNKMNKLPLPIYSDANKMYIAAWYNGGYFMVDDSFKILEYQHKLPGANEREYFKGVFDLSEDSKGRLWFLTNESLFRFDSVTQKGKEYPPPNQVFDKILFRKLESWNSQVFLIMSRNNGLYLFDKTKERYVDVLDKVNKSLGNTTLYDIVKFGSHNYYLATSKGLFLLNGMTLMLERENIDDICKSLSIDKEGRLWVGGEAGLYCKLGKKVFHYTTHNGLSHNYIEDLICDKNQNIWVLTLSGVSVFLPKYGSFYNLTMEHGLPRNRMDGYLANCPNGDVLITNNHFQLFTVDPDQIFQSTQKSKAKIIDIYVNDSLVNRSIFENSYNTLTVNHASSNISVKFTVPDYSHLGQIQYQYKITHIHNDWKGCDNGNILFNNLDPGNYILKVRGKYIFNMTYTGEESLHIKVLPEWYESYEFKLIIFALIAMALVLLYRRRISGLKLENDYKRKLLETKMHLLRAQMNPHFIFNSINSIENYIMRNEKRMASDYLIKFSRLIRNILDNGRQNAVPLSTELEHLQLYVDLEQMRFNHRFKFIMIKDQDLQESQLFIPPMIIQPYIENAILHGISHSEKNDLWVKLILQRNFRYLKVTIEDNGVGRERSAVYKLDIKNASSGLGIKMTEERIIFFNGDKREGVRIYDLKDHLGNISGTGVEFKLKMNDL